MHHSHILSCISVFSIYFLEHVQQSQPTEMHFDQNLNVPQILRKDIYTMRRFSKTHFLGKSTCFLCVSVSGRLKWVLSIFTAIRHLLHHFSMKSSIFCRASSLGTIRTMSSAFNSISNFVPLTSTPQFRSFTPVAKSFKQIENKTGLMMSPC